MITAPLLVGDKMKTRVELAKENKTLRSLLWLRHGCESSAKYGDDGEMQCNQCGIDFKRMLASDISKVFYGMNKREIEKMKKVAIDVFGLKEN